MAVIPEKKNNQMFERMLLCLQWQSVAKAIPAKLGTGFASGIALKQKDRALQVILFSPEVLYGV